MPGTMIARGNFLYSFAIQINITPSNVAGNSLAEQSFPVPGLQANDQPSAFSFTGPYTGNVDISNLRVSANTLTVAFSNGSGSPAAAPSGNWLLEINRLEASNYAGLPTSAA